MRFTILGGLAVSLAMAVACGGGTQPTQCSYSVSPAQATIAQSGGSTAIGVSAPSSCQWTAELNPASSWASASATSGAGTGTITITAGANPSTDARTVQVTVHGTSGAATASIRQDGVLANNCSADSYQIDISNRSIAAAGGAFSVNVTAPAGCAWTTATDASWIGITDYGPGFTPPVNAVTLVGNGRLDVTIAANAGSAVRTGTATIAGRTLTVTQDGTSAVACSYRLNSDTGNFSAAGGTGAVSVTTTANCSWWVDVTSSSEDFVRVSSAHVGGAGSRSFTVQPNSTMTGRSGRLAVYGDSGSAQAFAFFTVNQSGAGCLYTVTPATASFAATGGLGSFKVTTTPADCSWTASTSGSLFITITGGGSGTGAGTVTYQVNANTGAARSGGITVAGLSGLNPPAVHSISQAGTSFAGRD